MKIAFTTSGEDLGSPVDERFGRAPRLLLYDTDRDTYEVIENRKGVDASQGAGIQTAETVFRSGANCVVTGHCGPKAMAVLAAAGIKVYRTDAPTVREALEAFRAGRLTALASADVEGHWT